MKNFDVLFEDVTKHGTKIKASEYLEKGKFIIVDQGQELIAGYTNLEVGVYEDIPAIIFGDHTRIVKYVDEPFYIGADGVKILKVKARNMSCKFLFYALKNAKIPDTGYNRHFKWLKEVELFTPNIKKQVKIVEVLDRLNTMIECKRKQLTLYENLVNARFVEMFGDPSLNTKGYPVMNLSEIAEYWNGLTYKPEDVADEGTIVLRSSNIQNAQLDFEDTVRVTCNIGEKKYVQDNDVLMCSRNGSARLVGKAALIKDIEEPMSFGAFMMIIRSPYYSYLITYFQMPAFRTQITTGATTTINQITGRMLDNVKLPVPEESELESFTSFMNQVDKSKVS